jgi:hypothetical protein
MYETPKVAARMPTESFSLPVALEISHQPVTTAHITHPANARARILRWTDTGRRVDGQRRADPTDL